MYNLVALLPMKHISRRVPEKNYRLFGKNLVLFEHILIKLLQCSTIDKVVIDTDSDIIKGICKQKYPDVIVIDRIPELAEDHTSMNDVIKYDMDMIDSKFFLQTHATNPLLSSTTLRKGISLFFGNYPKYDSLFSVTRLQTRLWDQNAHPVNHNLNILARTQDLPPIYEENSCMYIFNKDIFLKNDNRIGHNPYLFEIDPIEAQDIDNEFEFKLSETIFSMDAKEIA